MKFDLYLFLSIFKQFILFWEEMASTKKFTKQPSEFIDTLPEDVFEIKNYISLGEEVEFNRYWYDRINHRIIMKPKHMKIYKIVKPMTDKYHDCRFAYLFDIADNKIWVNYDYICWSNSIGYYLNI